MVDLVWDSAAIKANIKLQNVILISNSYELLCISLFNRQKHLLEVGPKCTFVMR